jgi:hypothetical protein
MRVQGNREKHSSVDRVEWDICAVMGYILFLVSSYMMTSSCLYS